MNTSPLTLQHQEIGIMGTGSNMFRCGIAHSSGRVFVGTYGPAPGIIWQYDPATALLTKVGAPGEYQLDCMVEAPNGKIYIGTAYNGLVYELDPESGEIRDLGSPPGDSTPWIFTMIRTRDGEIYGAKGVGLFHLDWRTGKMESCGVVPGPHESPLISSAPITRTLEERPDGVLWGDTNRWIFTFDPKTREIMRVADVAATDDACYGIIHGCGSTPVMDFYFQIYSRFSGKTPAHQFFVCRAATGEIEPLNLSGLDGYAWANGWWSDGEKPRWLVTHREADDVRPTVAVVDLEQEKIIDRWNVEGNDRPPSRIAGPGLWFISPARGMLYQGDAQQKILAVKAVNPVPVECRSLAASPDGRLGTDTYDCGFAFTRDIATGEFRDHGPVWMDDHRSNYGPAAFAGEQGRYFLANHGESPEVTALWVTDTETNRHWRAGDSVVQLVRFRDGSVWGTQGPNPPWVYFNEICWRPSWQARPGTMFKYCAGEAQVELLENVGAVGPLAESPDPAGYLWFGSGQTLSLYNGITHQVVSTHSLPADVLALSTDYEKVIVYLVLSNGSVWSCDADASGNIAVQQRVTGFGSIERGCFLVPRSGRLIGIAGDGSISVFDPAADSVEHLRGPAPLPAGPAVDVSEDAWYFADREVVKYSLSQSR